MREISKFIRGEKSVYPGYIVDHGPKIKDLKIIDLIDQVEGIDRDQEPPTGFLAKFKRKEEIDIKAQLQAIHELGRSASQEALDFLTWLYTPGEETTSVDTIQLVPWESTISQLICFQEAPYPNARGPLKDRLHLREYSGYYYMADDHALSDKDVQQNLARQRALAPAHMTINYAIENLKKDLQLITQPDTPS